MLKTWKTDTQAVRIPKYINMLIFSVDTVANGYKQSLSFSIFLK